MYHIPRGRKKKVFILSTNKKCMIVYYYIMYKVYDHHLLEKTLSVLYIFLYLCTWPVALCAGMLPSLGPQTGKENSTKIINSLEMPKISAKDTII